MVSRLPEEPIATRIQGRCRLCGSSLDEWSSHSPLVCMQLQIAALVGRVAALEAERDDRVRTGDDGK